MANIKKKKKQAAAMQDNSTLLVKDKSNTSGGNDAESNLAEDVSETLDRFEAWAIANGKYILAACILILIGVAVFLTVMHYRNRTIAEATAELAGAAQMEELEKVLKKHPASTPGYDVAQIRLARFYASKQKYDQAYASYTAVAERKNEPYLSARSRLDAAYIKELAGKPAEAAAVFAMVADSADVLQDLRAEGAYAAGRLFLSCKNETAARKYLSMMDPMKASTQIASQWAMLSQALLNRITVPSVKSARPVPAKTAPAGSKNVSSVKPVSGKPADKKVPAAGKVK